MIRKITSETELPSLAQDLLQFSKNYTIFCFTGKMGAGKTTFIKVICQELGVTDSISSPSFAIINEYHGKHTVYHMDFYRIKESDELVNIGIEDYLYGSHFCLIEWPSKAANLLPEKRIDISISIDSEGSRIFEFKKL